MTTDAWYDTLSFPALLRGARTPYRKAIRAALAAGDFDDLPKGGAFVLGGMAREAAPLSEVIRGLSATKQATGYLVDTLVERGYLVREPDPSDGRRVTVVLTPRGRRAAEVVRGAVEQVDERLAAQVGLTAVHEARAVLGALTVMERRASE